jgi:hypothetical protein
LYADLPISKKFLLLSLKLYKLIVIYIIPDPEPPAGNRHPWNCTETMGRRLDGAANRAVE